MRKTRQLMSETYYDNITNRNSVDLEDKLELSTKHIISNRVANDIISYVLDMFSYIEVDKYYFEDGLDWDDVVYMYSMFHDDDWKITRQDDDCCVLTYQNTTDTRFTGLYTDGKEPSYLYDHADVYLIITKEYVKIHVDVNWHESTYPFIYTLDKTKAIPAYSCNPEFGCKDKVAEKEIRSQVKNHLWLKNLGKGLNL